MQNEPAPSAPSKPHETTWPTANQHPQDPQIPQISRNSHAAACEFVSATPNSPEKLKIHGFHWNMCFRSFEPIREQSNSTKRSSCERARPQSDCWKNPLVDLQAWLFWIKNIMHANAFFQGRHRADWKSRHCFYQETAWQLSEELFHVFGNAAILQTWCDGSKQNLLEHAYAVLNTFGCASAGMWLARPAEACSGTESKTLHLWGSEPGISKSCWLSTKNVGSRPYDKLHFPWSFKLTTGSLDESGTLQSSCSRSRNSPSKQQLKLTQCTPSRPFTHTWAKSNSHWTTVHMQTTHSNCLQTTSKHSKALKNSFKTSRNKLQC